MNRFIKPYLNRSGKKFKYLNFKFRKFQTKNEK